VWRVQAHGCLKKGLSRHHSTLSTLCLCVSLVTRKPQCLSCRGLRSFSMPGKVIRMQRSCLAFSTARICQPKRLHVVLCPYAATPLHARHSSTTASAVMSTASAVMSTAEFADKIWTISDLQILHQLQTPVFVAAFGMYSVSHRLVSRINAHCLIKTGSQNICMSCLTLFTVDAVQTTCVQRLMCFFRILSALSDMEHPGL